MVHLYGNEADVFILTAGHCHIVVICMLCYIYMIFVIYILYYI